MTALVIIAAFIAGVEFNSWYYNIDSLYEANQSKEELINAQFEYMNANEALLDSIAKWDNSFMDTTGETDAYWEYFEAKCRVDSILSTDE